jgi:hypothetical protein
MTMRLDYALYGLGIVLFALTAITFALVAETDGRSVYAISTAIVGVISLGGGYFLRPKAATVPVDQTAVPAQSVAAAEPAPVEQTVVPVVEEPKTEGQVAEAPVVEAPIAEPLPIQGALVVDAPKTLVVAEAQPKTQIVALAAEVPVVEAETQVAPAAKLEFVQIRSISEKRAEQLKANGISTLEELANANALDLAAKLNVSPKIVKMWIGSAKKLAK